MKKRLHIRVKITQSIITLCTFLIIALQGFAQETKTVVYEELTETIGNQEYKKDIMNPDRGFYYPYDSEGWYEDPGVYYALNPTTLEDRRTLAPFTPEAQEDDQGDIDADYSVNTSIILRHFILDEFRTSYISPTFLQKIQTDFNSARSAGVRMVLRFSYTLNPNPNADPCDEGFICPPYGDASKEWVIRHITQLTSLFQDNEDVIMVVQQGFIGTWGEQFYTDHFGDTSTNGPTYNPQTYRGYLGVENWKDRNEVLKALLDAVPESRQVQVRYPQMRKKFLDQHPEYENRLGFQNDCFLSSDSDVGTYVDFDSIPTMSKQVLRNYSDIKGNFVAVGGETCGALGDEAATYGENDCIDGGGAVAEMNRMNYSFLNCAYSYVVNNDWEEGGCMDEIKRRMGYRFVLNSGRYPKEAQKGELVNFNLNLDNVGFAAPFNKRSLFMMLTKDEGETFLNAIKIEGDWADIRTWRSDNNNTNNLKLRFRLPGNIAIGDYDMYLHIADLSTDNDGDQTIKDKPAYSIRLASQLSSNDSDVWDTETGYNNLYHSIEIKNTPPEPEPPVSNNCIDVTDNSFADWEDIVKLRTSNNPELTALKVADDNTHFYIHLSGTLKNHYQVFLDTDANKVVSNNFDQEYLNSHWDRSGFNYMIENGILRRFVSDNPWEWTEIDEVEQNVTNNGLELRVEKRWLEDLSLKWVGFAANTLDANWSGSAYLPVGDNGGYYELGTSNPCVEEDVCILIDGDGSDWQNVNTTHFNSGSSINELKITENSQYLFVYIKSSISTSNHTPQIFFDVYDDEGGFKGTNWDDNGFDFMMEYNTFHYYNGDGYSWGTWPELGRIERNYDGGNILEFKIPKYMFHESPASTTIKVAGYYKDSNWGHVNKLLPSSGASGINYTLNSNNSCSGLMQKTESNNNIGRANTKYNLESLQSLKNDGNSQKKDSQNCIAVDGSPNEWNAMGTYGYAATGSLTHIKVADNSNEILFYLEGGLDVNNQIYLNSDVNSTTLNRYNLSQWQYTGFNYLIENDILFVYDGTGDNWSWSQIGTVSHSISDNVLEVVVQKSQLTNLSGSIGFAATSLNDDYKETGAIPQSNSALNYLTGTKDLCNIKPTCLNVNGNIDQWLNINEAAQLTNSDNLQSIKISDGSESLYILLEGYMDVYQQVFIDSDNDAVGANEYTDSNWSQTGFNYLVDEGDLFIYQGDGTSWDWKPIGAVNMITSKYWTELSLKKYLLGNITGEIQVAASSFDADWAETSFIPAAEEATAYTPSTNNLSLFFHQNGINFHQAYDVIESSANLINSNTNEVYKAGKSIQLNKGFSSPPVTDFDAYIEACE